MEFPEIGHHCDFASCKQLDFLPFKCDACGGTFCVDHRIYYSHDCPEKQEKVIPECPLCHQIIPIGKNENVNAKVDQHITAGCPKIENRNSIRHKCSKRGCNGDELFPVVCKLCHKNFCLKHRFPDDHLCEKLSNTSNTTSTTSTTSTISTTSKSPLSNFNFMKKEKEESKGKGTTTTTTASSVKKETAKATAANAKITLMKMKSMAVGNDKVIITNRFYLAVLFSVANKPLKCMFFDKNWTVGKILDIIADSADIENKNNLTSNEEEKLHLFSAENDYQILPNDMPLKELEEYGMLSNGGNILLFRGTTLSDVTKEILTPNSKKFSDIFKSLF